MPDVELSTGVNTSGAAAGMAQLRNVVHKEGAAVSSAVASMFAVGSVIAFGRELLNIGSRVNDLSERFGVGTKFLQQWGNAAEESGSSMEEVAAALNKQIIAVSKANGGNAEMLKHFAALGVTAEDLRTRAPEEIFEKIANSSKNAESMVAVFGRGALALVPTMEAVAAGGIQLGDVIDDSIIKRLDAADDALTRWGQKAKIIAAETVGAFDEVTTSIANFIDKWVLLPGIPGRSTPAPKPGEPGFIGPMPAPRDASSPEAPAAGAARGAGGASTAEKIAKINRDFYMESLTNEQKLRVLQKERLSIQDTMNRVAMAGALTPERELSSLEKIAANSKEIAKVEKEIADAKKKKADAETRVREQADRERARRRARRPGAILSIDDSSSDASIPKVYRGGTTLDWGAYDRHPDAYGAPDDDPARRNRNYRRQLLIPPFAGRPGGTLNQLPEKAGRDGAVETGLGSPGVLNEIRDSVSALGVNK